MAARMSQFWKQFKARSVFWFLMLFILGFVCVLFACTANGGGSNSTFNSAACGSPSSGPTDNPVASRYADAPPWTQQIQWSCVYNIRDFEGATDTDRFNGARERAIAHGGGVVYFPAGIYQFSDNLSLANGIVLRGETPTSADAKSDVYRPPTRLEFPKYEPSQSDSGGSNQTAFKKILTQSPNADSNLGLVNIDINRAGVELIGDPDTGENQNIVILGVRSNNVAEPDAGVPDPAFQAAWLRYSNRFVANFKISAYANVLVANNRLNDAITDSYEQPGYTVRARNGDSIIAYTEGWKVPFDYANHYGIVVNRSKSGGFQYAAEPTLEPGLFRQGIVIQDNWIYKTMRVGVHASGSGLVIRNNQIYDQSDKQVWTDPTGKKQPRGSATFENRAIDWSGHDVLIEGNRYQVYRHRLMDSQYASVDGEGILIQQCCGGTSVNGAAIRGNAGNAYIGLYKIPDIQNVLITENELTSDGSQAAGIYVSADTNGGPNPMSTVRIENNRLAGDIRAQASAGGRGNFIQGNQADNGGSIRYSCHINVWNNPGFELDPCSGSG